MTKQARREAFERRTWRLALLLTGDAWGASRTLDITARALGDMAGVDPVRLDRLVIMHARDVATLPASKRGLTDEDAAPPEGPAANVFAVLRKMKPQPREAWVLTHVDQLDSLHTARAMDASKTASGHHLAAAEAMVAELLGDDAEAGLEGLRSWADEIDPEPWLIMHRERMRRRRKIRWVVIGVCIAAVAATALIIALSV